MSDLRIVDAPEIPTEEITGSEKLPTGGNGNYSISLDSLANHTKTSLDLANKTDVQTASNGVKAQLDQHKSDLNNPHQVTKVQIGLENVDNTADADKPMSNVVQSAITTLTNNKADKTSVYLKTETYNKTEIDSALSTKPNSTTVYTKTEINNLLNGKVTSVNGKTGTAITLNRSDLGISSDIIMQQWEKEAQYVIDENGENQQLVNDKFRTLTDFYVTPEMYGIRNGYWTDAIQWCVNTGKEIVLSAKQYDIDKPIFLNGQSYKIRGVGGKLSIINKVNDSKLGLANVSRQGLTSVVSFEIDKDAVFICYSEGYQQLNFSGFRLQKYYQESRNDTGYALFAPFISEFVCLDFFTWFAYYGVYTIDCWMSSWIRCHSNAKAGYVFGGLDSDNDFLRGGTSLSLISTWSTDTGDNESAFRLTGMAYSSVTSCGSDNIGKETTPAFSTWSFYNCANVALTSCGCEVVHAKHLFYAFSSNISVKNHFLVNFYNHYSDLTNPYLIVATENSKLEIDFSRLSFNNEWQAGYPNFAVSDWGSKLYLINNSQYPSCTGNNNGVFGVYNAHNSYSKFLTDGFGFTANNLAFSTSVANYSKKEAIDSSLECTATTGNFGLVGTAGRWNTSVMRIGESRLWFSTTLEKLMVRNYLNPTSDIDGAPIGGCAKGSTANRPATISVGMMYLDTTLAPNGKPIWVSDVDTWVDATGTIV